MAVVRNFKFGLYINGTICQPADVVIPKVGVVGITWHILEFYIPRNISGMAEASVFKFRILVGREKY